MLCNKPVWSKNTVEWVDGNTAFVSVPFTWNLLKAFPRCAALKQEGYHVRAGGPAVSLMPDYLATVAEIGGANHPRLGVELLRGGSEASALWGGRCRRGQSATGGSPRA